MTDQEFHNVGVDPQIVQRNFVDPQDHGAATGIAAAIADPLDTRGAFSDGDDGRLTAGVTFELEGAFRTPGLRCVSQRPTFMHTGQLATLDQVVAFFDQGGDKGGYPGGSEIAPLGLTPEERGDLVAFLEALAGPGADSKYLQAP